MGADVRAVPWDRVFGLLTALLDESVLAMVRIAAPTSYEDHSSYASRGVWQESLYLSALRELGHAVCIFGP